MCWLMEGWSAPVLHREKVDYESRKKGSYCWLMEGWSAPVLHREKVDYESRMKGSHY